ncbi:MAG: hypothetical protein Q9225_006228 [Loekoesia sp. 1 TL-2023]
MAILHTLNHPSKPFHYHLRVALAILAVIATLILIIALKYIFYRILLRSIQPQADLELGPIIHAPHRTIYPRDDHFQDIDLYADAGELFEVGSMTEDEYFSDEDDDDVSVSSLLPGLRSPLSVIVEEEEEEDVVGLSFE